jgi:hypothetical protein
VVFGPKLTLLDQGTQFCLKMMPLEEHMVGLNIMSYIVTEVRFMYNVCSEATSIYPQRSVLFENICGQVKYVATGHSERKLSSIHGNVVFGDNENTATFKGVRNVEEIKRVIYNQVCSDDLHPIQKQTSLTPTCAGWHGE